MKKKTEDLDVDFIQSRPLTKDEEQKLSEYIKQLKKKNAKTNPHKKAA